MVVKKPGLALRVLGSLAAFSLVLSALPVFAEEAAQAEIPLAVREAAEQAKEARDRNLESIPVTFAGVQVGIDPETGKLRPVTPAEAKKLAAEMKKMFANKGPKAEHTKPVFKADGSLSAVLPVDHLSATVAVIGADGRLHTDCLATHGASGSTEGLKAEPSAPQAEEK